MKVRLLRRRRTESPAFKEAQVQFKERQLPFPNIPVEMRADFQRLGEWVFGTGHDGQDLLVIQSFQQDALVRPEQSFVLLGQSGYGINSYAMHYYLARNPLYLFLQIAYGGYYVDPEKAIESMKRRFAHAERLMKAMPEAINPGVLDADERWIITDSDFYGSAWIKVKSSGVETVIEQEPDSDSEVLPMVLEWLATAAS